MILGRIKQNWRVYITIIAIISFVMLFNFYLWVVKDSCYSFSFKKLLCNYTISGMLVFYYLNKYSECEITHEFNKIGFYTVLSNFLILLLYYHGFVIDAVNRMLIFNGLIFAVTISIFISMIRNGYFKNKYEND